MQRAASLLVIIFVLGMAQGALCQCRKAEEVVALREAFEQSLRCPEREGCSGHAARSPFCAGTFADDLRNLTGASRIQRGTPQGTCEQQILNSTADYVWTKYDRIIRHKNGISEAESVAARAWDPVGSVCRVPVTKTGREYRPALWPQCSSTLGPPGSLVDSQGLANCLHNHVQAWFDLRYGPIAEPEFPR